MNHINRAAEIIGNKRKLAESLGISPGFVSQWFTGHRPVPPKYCIPIEQATEGQVTRYQLRPDIFGEPEDRGAA